MATTADATARRDALVERLFMNAIGAFDLFSVYLGDALGLYRTLADKGQLTSAELAEAAGVHERYAREWLEQQAASELLEVQGDEEERRFRLPEGHDEALLDVSSLNYVAPMARAVLASIRPVDALLAAFRSGDGVPYADYGENLHEAQAAFTRPLFENLLGKEWLPSVPELHERLLADPPARVADVACGQGRSSIELARAYPKVLVDGIDSDRASIERARENLAGTGLEERVAFRERDAADAGLAGRYDLVTIFEALHDMSYPVDVLRAARGLLADGGLVFVGDERTEDGFTAPGGRDRTSLLRLQRLPLPAGRNGRRGSRRHRHRDPRRHGSRLRGGSRLLELRGAAHRARLLALLPPAALAGRRTLCEGFVRAYPSPG
jgi:2-polyprenyl-3-methyl-5-hydroxy-6-metoxy-1,4-benzoquinol methylase